ncbi:MAG: glycosyltransferase family 2 protein [Lachnospiraceae bacterium]
MDKYNFKLEMLRFHLTAQDTLVFRGWYREDNPQHREVVVYLDGKELQIQLEIKRGIPIRQKYLRYQEDISEELVYTVSLPENWSTFKFLKIMTVGIQDSIQYTVATLKVSELCKQQNQLEYNIENETIAEERLIISGWCMDTTPIEIISYDGNEICKSAQITRTYRKDVRDVFEEVQEGYQSGFKIELPIPKSNHVTIVFQGKKNKSIYKTTVSAIRKGKNTSLNAFQKFVAYYKRDGILSTLNRIKVKVFHQQDRLTYSNWLKKYQTTPEELAAQRTTQFPYQPQFSIVIPLYKTNHRYLKEMLDSICSQTYSNWEICLADGSGAENSLQKIVEEYQRKHPRIKLNYQLLTENLGISENTNAAIAMAEGDYIVLADHDDLLGEQALFECAKVLNSSDKNEKEDKDSPIEVPIEVPIDVLYSDEDKIDMEGKKQFDPHFKSDLNIDLLCSMNYICHLFVVKKTLLDKVGLLRKEFDGAQDHDFILRCVEMAERVYHIPKVLYHWRCHMDSTASNPESKLYAFEAGRKAVEAHYQRLNIPATASHSTFYGMFRTKYHWEQQPLISIIIPNKDHINDLQKCMESIENKSTYGNFEFVIVENNSTQPETFAYYKKITEKENVQVVCYQGEFNFSKINNYGETFARGEYLLLLNNDTEMITPECLEEMLGYCMREDVGIVGAKLCYQDDTIQHAGVVIGFGGMAGHAFIESSRYDTGYMGRIMCAQDYSAVTAACLMTKRTVYQQVGGLTEEYEVAFNDIDYCLKVRELGKLVVYNPYAELYHYESKSRGMEDTPEKIQRFNSEVARFMQRWQKILKEGDPYYNPALSLDKADFSLKN